jgi:hypothetical protein
MLDSILVGISVALAALYLYRKFCGSPKGKCSKCSHHQERPPQ